MAPTSLWLGLTSKFLHRGCHWASQVAGSLTGRVRASLPAHTMPRAVGTCILFLHLSPKVVRVRCYVDHHQPLWSIREICPQQKRGGGQTNALRAYCCFLSSAGRHCCNLKQDTQSHKYQNNQGIDLWPREPPLVGIWRCTAQYLGARLRRLVSL